MVVVRARRTSRLLFHSRRLRFSLSTSMRAFSTTQSASTARKYGRHQASDCANWFVQPDTDGSMGLYGVYIERVCAMIGGARCAVAVLRRVVHLCD